MMSIKVSSRKAKGRRLQNLVAGKISKILNIPWGKDKLIQGREMGQSGVDIKLYGEAKEKFPFAIECKNTEKMSLTSWVKQAKENLGDFKYWMIVYKKNNFKPVVILDLDDFIKILEKGV